MSLALFTLTEEGNPMRKLSTLTPTLFLIGTLAAGCATHQRTETVQYEDRRGGPVAVERTTTTSTDTSSDADSGVLSSTVNVVGEVISLPFRAVGGLLRAIF
jgi:hypothetical protein